MAKDKAKEESKGDEAPPKKKGKMLLIVGVLLVLVGAGGGAAWYFTQSGEKHAEHKEEKPKPPVFVTLETFTVNLQTDGGGEDHYLQVGIDLKVTDASVVDLVKLHMPEIRNGVLLLLSSKNSEQIASLEGKQKLSADIQEQINKPLNAKAAGKGVTGVYFTSFVIQ